MIKQMYYFYVLKSEKDNRLYKGFAKDVGKRVAEHNSGKVIATKNRRPFYLIYTEEFIDKEDAIKKEKYYKSYTGGKKLGKILERVNNRG